METTEKFIDNLINILITCERSTAFAEHIDQGAYQIVYFDTFEEANVFDRNLKMRSHVRPVSGFFVYLSDNVPFIENVNYGMETFHTCIGKVKMFYN